MKGTVKFINVEVGYGIITPEDGSMDLFVHQQAVQGDIHEGDTVQFQIQYSRNGRGAKNVKKLNS